MRNLQEKFASAPQHTKCTPRQSNLGHFLLGGGSLEVYLVVLDRLSRGRRLKKVVNFFNKKVHPQKSWLLLVIPWVLYMKRCWYKASTGYCKEPQMSLFC